ncbi:MAG TPA: glycosyl hydrolase [Clostridia bacterium]|nr:glycosyl hydrolase [Clostridia bacterium]
MLYGLSKQPALTKELFQNPTMPFRGAPFWAWNCALDARELCRQIDVLREMGMGGFHIHTRTGMATPYLSEEFLHLVRACVEKGKESGMLTWLYDEDRWPSGVAGGFVTQDRAMGQQYLRFAPARQAAGGALIARYAVALTEDGALAAYRRLGQGEEAEGAAAVYVAELLHSAPETRYNHQPYVNTLDRRAIERFIECTHERYRSALGDEFGKAIPAIFTDEPQFLRKRMLASPFDQVHLTLPWTVDLPDTYRAAFGEDLLDRLPELFWELPDDQRSVARYRYHEHLAERFAHAFADTCGEWCAKHGILLTGHMMAESTLQSQTLMLGEAMRSYRAFQLPGIDMLCDAREYTTAKQAQSAARQYGREGVMSELYGVTNWDFDFRGHKLQGDWQAAMGVTLRVHHLAWVSMEGEAKRDYPASIHYQSPWYRKYRYVEDHFARLNTALTRGKSMARIGVIHPIESYWLHFGPQQQTAGKRQELDRRFAEITEWLSFGLMDFDFICESLLPGLCPAGRAPLKVSEMAYDAVVVPACETLRASTVDRLQAFAEQGGCLVVMGGMPARMDAALSARPAEALRRCREIEWSQTALLDALEPLRLLDVRDEQGMRTQHVLAQLRADGEGLWLFLCNGRAVPNGHPQYYGGMDADPLRYLDRGHPSPAQHIPARRDADCAHGPRARQPAPAPCPGRRALRRF